MREPGGSGSPPAQRGESRFGLSASATSVQIAPESKYWLAGHYPLWKAAVAGAPLTDWVEMYDLSDGNVTAASSTGATPYLGDGMAINRRQSPASSVAKIRAPTLILCDTGDFRVPIAQSFGLYRALKDNHVTTEFYAIPTAGHFASDPILQMDVYQRWIDWLVKYLT